MQTPKEGSNFQQEAPSSTEHGSAAQPGPGGPKPIADFVTRPDFPDSLLGEAVDIGGYTGTVVAIVKNSIKVRSPEGVTRSFNSFNLRRIYGPAPEFDPLPERAQEDAPAPRVLFNTAAETEPAPRPQPKPAPPREVIEEPNFDQPIIPIRELIAQPDFPKSAFGRHVDIGGYTGGVVEIVNESLKVRCEQGTSRSYNSIRLRGIYGPSS
jgi:hypothetical protein